MIKTGIDVVEIDRIKKLSQRKNFNDFLFTDNEIKYIESRKGRDAENGEVIIPYSTIAGLYAAKEAITKAFGIGLSKKLNFKEVEIGHTKEGAPYVNLHGFMGKFFMESGNKDISISISHDGGVAIAICVIN